MKLACYKLGDLYELIIKNRPFRPAILEGGSKTDNWCSQQIFALDFDSGLISFEDALIRSRNQNLIPNIWYETPSSTKELVKFRIVYILDQPVTDSKIAEKIRYGLLAEFPEADPKCVDAVRFFNGTNKSNHGYYNELNNHNDFISRFRDFSIPTEKRNTDPNATISLKENKIIQLRKNFNWDLLIERSTTAKAFFSGTNHQDKPGNLKYNDLHILACNLNMIDGGLKKMQDTMKQFNADGITSYDDNDFKLLVEVNNRGYKAQSFIGSNFIEDRGYKSIFDIVKHDFEPKKKAEPQKYISDLISREDVSKWTPQQPVFIEAGTGRGKTTFINSILSDYASSIDRRVLLLENRRIAKDQIEKEFANYDEIVFSDNIVVVLTYQYLEYYKKKHNKGFDFSPYSHIVCDEAHYFLTDCTFNKNIELSWLQIRERCSDHVKIFMTASPSGMIELLNEKYDNQLLHHDMGICYDHVEKFICFSTDPEKYANKIFEQCQKQDTKCMLLADDFQLLFEMLKKFESESFLIAALHSDIKNTISDPENQKMMEYLKTITFNKANKEQNEKNDDKDKLRKNIHLFVDQKSKRDLIDSKKLSNRFLLATSVLDTGFSIEDESVSDVIIITKEPHKLIQWAGRYRSKKGSKHKINIHVADFNRQGLNNSIKSIEKKLTEPENSGELIQLALNRELNLFRDIHDSKYTWTNLLEEGLFGREFEYAKSTTIDSSHIETVLNKYVDMKIVGEKDMKEFYYELNIKKTYQNGDAVPMTKPREINEEIKSYGFMIEHNSKRGIIFIKKLENDLICA